jgi:transposase
MIPSSVKIYLCTEPVDMRKSFDGLAQTTLDILRKDPRSGALFLFANRRSTMLKILWFDKGGLCILAKRLKRAVFRLPDPLAPGVSWSHPAKTLPSGGECLCSLDLSDSSCHDAPRPPSCPNAAGLLRSQFTPS